MDWTLRRLLDDAGIGARTPADPPIRGISHVSSQVRAGEVFCCIPGDSFDGHDFAAAAVDAGAVALLVERVLDVDVPQVVVPSVREAIGPLAASFHGRPSERMRLVGITGTNGKTTTTYLLEDIAEAAGARAGVVGTIECRLGDRAFPKPRTGTPEAAELQPLLAAMADADADIVAMEVTSQALAKHRVDGTRFACAVFTNLTADHVEWHGSMEEYFEAKARLFDSSFATRAVVNVDDPYGERLAARARGVDVWRSSSRGRSADVAALDVTLRQDGVTARLRTPAGAIEIASELLGRYNVDNLLGAAGAALAIGLPLDAVAAGVLRVPRLRGRLEPVDEGQPFTVLIDYAHTPDALENALGAAGELASGRTIVVFGCGGDRDRGKRPQMGEVATRLADLTVITSDNPRGEDPIVIIRDIEAGARAGAFVVEPDRREAIATALREARAGDVVLIAGKGHEQGQTFADRTVAFDDRVVATELLGELPCRS